MAGELFNQFLRRKFVVRKFKKMAQFISMYVRGVHGQFSSLLSLQSSDFSLSVVSQSRKNLESKEIT